MNRPVTIVILTWNGLEMTRRCLDSLTTSTAFPNYHLVVVDNGSSDGTADCLEKRGDIHVLRNTVNTGFAAAVNRGIRHAPADHDIVLLNNDTVIEQADWLVRMQECAHRSADTGLVGCRLRNRDGSLQHAGAYLPLDHFRGTLTGGGERDIGQYRATRDVESVVFACVYLKREVLDAVGLLDEDYFCYYEDTDYCYRAAQRGYRTVYCGDVTILHHENASTENDPGARRSFYERGRRVFVSKWEEALRSSRYTRELGWQSVLSAPTGYAISSRQMAAALDEHGVFLSYKYAYGPGTPIPSAEPPEAASERIRLIRSRKLKPEHIQVVYGQGDVFEANSGSYKIGFTMLETDAIPKEWVRQANSMDEVWTPSAFNATTFRDSGVTRPIYTIPLGVDPHYFHPDLHSYRITGAFTFLSVFEWGARKAPELLLRAFNHEFRASEPVILLVKTTNSDPAVDVEREVRNLGLDPQGGAIHLSLNQLIPTYQLGSLYRSADCFVLPTRGEGWGMPIMEAMACGLPVIATDWSAQRDFMNEGNAFPLAVERLAPARAKCPYYEGFRWAEPSYTELRRLLRYVYTHQGEARAKGERAASEMAACWTWEHSARAIIARLDAIEGRPRPVRLWPENLYTTTKFNN